MISLGLGLWSTTILSRLGFSPSALFANGEVGVWYDPSPETTFTDTAGTAPATVGSAVALMLDKSQGLELGPELFPTTKSFEGTGWSTSPGNTILTQDGTGSSGADRIEFSRVVGAYVEISFRVSGAGTVNFRDSITVVGADLGAGTYTFRRAFQTNINWSPTGTEVVIDNISVKELPGFHATQSTAAARPILARVPASGRRNLLTRTEEFDNAAWVKVASAAVTPNTYEDLDTITSGGSTSRVQQVNISIGGDNISASLDVKVGTATQSQIAIWNGAVSVRLGQLVFNWTDGVPSSAAYTGIGSPAFENKGNGVWRITIACATAGSITASLLIYPDNTAGLGTMLAGRTQLELGSTATDYQRVGSTYDVTEAGQADNYHLVFDGVDDSMVTPSIDFTGTDEMSVFAGVRKLSDAAFGVVVEASTNPSDTVLNPGAFSVGAPAGSGSANFRFASGGTVFSSAVSPSVYPSPTTRIISGLGDISGDTSTLRINGTQVAQNTGDQGSGNYGNYPLYIGSRAGTSLPFNGHIYSLIVRGALTADNLLNQTETYVASKTAGVSI